MIASAGSKISTPNRFSLPKLGIGTGGRISGVPSTVSLNLNSFWSATAPSRSPSSSTRPRSLALLEFSSIRTAPSGTFACEPGATNANLPYGCPG